MRRGDAGDEQGLIEHAQLVKHQRLAGALLRMSADQVEQVIGSARAEIVRWRRGRLCSRDCADKWDQLLDLPVGELTVAMTSESLPWGSALRQNSPFLFDPEATQQEEQ